MRNEGAFDILTLIFLILFTVIMGYPAHGDLPENVVDSGSYEVIQSAGDDHIVDAFYSEDDSITYCFGYSILEDDPAFWVLSVDHTEILRQDLRIQQENPPDWTVGTFSGPGQLLIIDGVYSPGLPPEFHMIDLIDPENNRHYALPVDIDTEETLIILSLIKSSDGGYLAAGTRRFPVDHHSLFVMKLMSDGTILWETQVMNDDIRFIETVLGMTGDGGCVLSCSQDFSFPSSIPVYRLGNDGRILWQNTIEIDDEFTGEFFDFLELTDGRIICTGFVDLLQMALRGFSVSLSPGGEELWRRIDWYNDHTLFVSASISREDYYIISGWTAEEGNRSFEIGNTNILFAVMKNDGSSITGTELLIEKNQRPHSSFLTGSGQIIVIGIETRSEELETDVFFWSHDLIEVITGSDI